MTETEKPLAAWAELNEQLRRHRVEVMLGGGLGLYLLQIHRTTYPIPTLIPRSAWPGLRATSDVDVFLPLSLLVDPSQFAQVRLALSELGYEPSLDNKFWQFQGTQSGTIVDILTGPADDPRLKGDSRRVRPKGPKLGEDLHAHPTPDALALESEAVLLPARHEGEQPTLIAGPTTYLLMKLHTYADRSKPGDRRFDAHKSSEQAIDLFRIIAMLTEVEFEHARARLKGFQEESVVVSAGTIVAASFSSISSAGLLALRSHPSGQLIPEHALTQFMEALDSLFPSRTP